MNKTMLTGSLLMISSVFSGSSYAADSTELMREQDAIRTALTVVGVEVLGIRFDEPDKQWDVFIKSEGQAYEVEVDAVTGMIVASEKESLEEIQAELSGDLSHEGVAGDSDE